MRLRAALLAAALTFPAAASAQELLRIGVESGPTSLDPHYASLITNIAFARHVFEPLVQQDARQNLRPAIASAWRVVDDLTWEFTLDPKARFHDGAPVTAEDVAFSLGRAGNVPNSPSSFGYATRVITAVEDAGGGVVRIRTRVPTPLLANNLALVMIVSRKHGEGATTASKRCGKARAMRSQNVTFLNKASPPVETSAAPSASVREG